MADRQVTFDILARDRASGTLEKVGKSFGGLSTKAVAVGTAIGNLAASGVTALGSMAVSAVKTGISTAAALQQANIGFETLLGSADKAKAYVADLSKFAANTPFEFPGLVDASRQLLGVGVASKDVIPMLTDFGDAAGALSIKQDAFQRIMLATSQAISAGKFQAGDLNQIMTNGLPVWTLLSKAMHKSVPELRDLASHGKLLSKDVLPALQKQMHKDYGGAMAKQSQTLSGLWSTLQDTFSQGMAQALQPIIPMLTKSLPKAISALGKALEWGGKTLQKFMDSSAPGKIKTAIGAVVDVGKKLTGWFKTELNPFIRETVDKVMPIFRLALDNIRAAFKSTGESGTNWGAVLKNVGQVVKVIFGAIVVAVAAFALSFSIQLRVTKAIIENVVIPAFRLLAKIVLTQFGLIIDGATAALGWIPGIGPKLKRAQKDFHRFADSVNASLDSINSTKTVTIKMRTVGAGNVGGSRSQNNARNIGDIRGQRALGGSVKAGFAYQINERGQETFVPGVDGAVLPNGFRSSGGGAPVTVIVRPLSDREQQVSIDRGQVRTKRAGTYVRPSLVRG